MQNNDFYKYFQNALDTVITNLYNEGVLDEVPEVKYYYETGAYIENAELPYNNEDDDSKPILIKISNKERIQDPTVAINTFIQTVNIEFLCFEDQVYDLNKIIFSFFSQYRSKLDSLDNTPIFINITRTNDYVGVDLGAAEKMTTSLDVIITVYEEATLSNTFELFLISGEQSIQLKPDAISFNRDTTLVADLIKTNNVKFFPNTTVFTMAISGILSLKNTALLELFNSCTNNSRFGDFFTLDLRYTSTGKSVSGFPKQLYIKTSKFDLISASVAKYSIQFYEGVKV